MKILAILLALLVLSGCSAIDPLPDPLYLTDLDLDGINLKSAHISTNVTYISGTGTAGIDNTAMVVKSMTIPANTLKQVGDRIRIRGYWEGDTGPAITLTCTLNGVTIAHITDLGAANLQLNEVWLQYIDNTHANIIEMENGVLGNLSDNNVVGFDWNSDQTLDCSQDAVLGNHIILYTEIVDLFPKGGY